MVFQKKFQSGFPCNPVTSFYITDFSDDITEAHVWKEMMKHGKVVDVFFAKKRNKVGKRFGFVRFLDVENMGLLLGSIKITVMKGCKMITSSARFERKNMQNGGGVHTHVNHMSVSLKKQEAGHMHGRGSYADILRRTDPSPVSPDSSFTSYGTNNLPVVRLSSSPMVWEWAKSILIGQVSSYTKLLNVEELKNADGCFDIRFRYIGGLHVLVELENETAANEFLMKSKDVWCNWFVDLVKWTKAFAVPKRLAVLKIGGLPPHTWNTGAFDETAKIFGEVIIPEECSTETRNWDTGKVIILTKEKCKIDQAVKLFIDNEEFTARVFEDMAESARLIPGSLNSSSSKWSDSDSGTEITSEDESVFGSFRDEEFGECSPEKMAVNGISTHAPMDGKEVSGDSSKIGNNQLLACPGNVSLSNDILVGNPKSKENNAGLLKSVSITNEESDYVCHFQEELGECSPERATGENEDGGSKASPVMEGDVSGEASKVGNESNMIRNHACGVHADFGSNTNMHAECNSGRISSNLNNKINEAQDEEWELNNSVQMESGGLETNIPVDKIKVTGVHEDGNCGIESGVITKRKTTKQSKKLFDLNKFAGSHFTRMISSSSSQSISRRQNSSRGGKQSISDVAIEVQKTMEIGNLVGFDMAGTEEEIRRIILESGA